ncbi:hypothetical protein ARAM_000111 [Aspergillus rambellii]|uniref:Mating locus protein n=1 Tax=Aspergillus rambellii TaxID=308745 RepID=A0A0F8UZG1_9EURO|nr:hypothetical protein ARAM_000111 [Aspergillus rambellii]
MDPFTRALLSFLETSIGNANLSPEQREQAAYIKASFPVHGNSYRLMAQIAALFNGQVLIHPSHRGNGLKEGGQMPVCRDAKYLQAIVNDYHVTPTISDFEGHPIELMSILEPDIEAMVEGAERFKFHQALLKMEKKANEDLARYTKKYGYHFILRAGLKQYYLTKTVAENINFLRQDPRGDQSRMEAQKICYEAMDDHPHLSDREKTILVQATNCVPEDAHQFWSWIEKSRVSYDAMKASISLMNRPR